jgi:hypothetical protein
MNKRATQRRTRRAAGLAVSFMLVVVATGMVIIAPFPHGAVLLSLTHEHGITAGDLPAIALYLVAALLALWSMRASAR